MRNPQCHNYRTDPFKRLADPNTGSTPAGVPYVSFSNFRVGLLSFWWKGKLSLNDAKQATFQRMRTPGHPMYDPIWADRWEDKFKITGYKDLLFHAYNQNDINQPNPD